MIDLYTWGTPNGQKVSIMLEEINLAYRVYPINILQNDQFTAEFTAINPNQKIPAIVDHDTPNGIPLTLSESGAILIYLADKTQRFLPKHAPERYTVLQWLMFQMSGFGPMLGQAHHFLRFAPETLPYAQQRYQKEAHRLYRVLEQTLATRNFIAHDYSIADIALLPWSLYHEWQQIDIQEFPHVQTWQQRLLERPAVQRGLAIPT